ncbi:MAG TPA: substrate-binding domain-containing protein [Flavobacterium sp.]|nr:substrate-binding domain-containing protein [Flavobacterium sp.]
MPKYLKLLFALFAVIFAAVSIHSCKNEKDKAGVLSEEATLYVDETVIPVIEDEKAVFESQNTARLNLIPQAETEILSAIQTGKPGLLIMSRVLTDKEQRIFADKKIVPKITQIAIDGIALIVNKKASDSIIELQNIINFMQGKKVSAIKGLVFDNPNSSTINYIKSLAGVEEVDGKNVFALKNNNEVIKYISENNGYIGAVGVNWITQPMPEMADYIANVRVLAVKNVKNSANPDQYYKPTQSNLGEGLYPLVRKIYMLNYEGKRGLGTSFATFAAGDIGQKIVLKSGLAPVRLELREVKVK